MSLANELRNAVGSRMAKTPGGPKGAKASVIVQHFQSETAPASVAQHIIRSGAQASALRPRPDVGSRAPTARLGNRDVADNSTASQPTSNHLPANPSDDLPPTVPAGFANALDNVKRKVAGLKSKGLAPDVVHQAMMEDVIQLAKQHGVIGGAVEEGASGE